MTTPGRSSLDRAAALDVIRTRRSPWDLIVIGGGATGLGVAVDAAARGYQVALFEAADFAKGTSGRSTKLVHGGVRYLQQGNISLVMDALSERGKLQHNAPHLVRELAFVVPSYQWWESPFYGIGLKVYDLLAGRYGFGHSRHLSRQQVIAAIPSICTAGLRGGTRYFDGQFDDARLALTLARTAAAQGATITNYTKMVALIKNAGSLDGIRICDVESGEEIEVFGRVIINATGPGTDAIRRLDQPNATKIVAPSQGAHIVLDGSFIPNNTAIMVPRTDDGRVLFVIPWRGVALIGTTDTSLEHIALEPRPLDREIDFLLKTANRYLARPAARNDIKSAFAGIRPLVKTRGGSTASLSRDHTILVDPDSGLLSVVGGKWTTYRKMAEDVVDQAAVLGGLAKIPCPTSALHLHGYHPHPDDLGRLGFYGTDADAIHSLAAEESAWSTPIHPDLDTIGAEVVWACRHEMARTVDDVLARRSRALILDARAAAMAAETVAALMATELGRDAAWQKQQILSFKDLAQSYIIH